MKLSQPVRLPELPERSQLAAWLTQEDEAADRQPAVRSRKRHGPKAKTKVQVTNSPVKNDYGLAECVFSAATHVWTDDYLDWCMMAESTPGPSSEGNSCLLSIAASKPNAQIPEVQVGFKL